MYNNLQEIYKNSVFQILKILKAFSNFDFNLAIRKNALGCAVTWNSDQRKIFVNWINLTCKLIHPRTHLVISTLFLVNKKI